MFSPIIRSTLLYLQHVVLSYTNVALPAGVMDELELRSNSSMTQAGSDIGVREYHML
jgi:hypothetical protein